MRSRPLLTYFVLVYLITWGVAGMAIGFPEWFRARFGTLDSSNPMFFLAVYAPSLTSIALTAGFEGRPGLARLFARLDPRRCHPIWYLVVIGGAIVFGVVVTLIGRIFGGPPPVLSWAGFVGLGVALFADAGPIGEELGWRGYALPRMLTRWSPLTATAILGLIWGIWHLPAFYVSTLSQSRMSLPLFLIGALSLSLVMGWLFLRSRGSVLIAILAHLMANHTGDVTGMPFVAFTWGVAALAVLLVVTGQFRREPSAEHTAG